MDKIRQAVERARADRQSSKSDILDSVSAQERISRDAPRVNHSAARLAPLEHHFGEVELNAKLLQSERVVSYDGKDQRSRPYDMLRTQILQSMDANNWKVLGVTSPTPQCGKTLTAINLSFSIARQPDRSVVLMDLDLQRPQISQYFGVVPSNKGSLGVLEDRTPVRDVTVPVRAGNQQMTIIPTASSKESAELMGSRQMTNLLRDLRKDFQIAVLDLPPILSSDDVIALLPQVDCVLLVVTSGLTKPAEIEECLRHLQPSQLVRVVLNKATEPGINYYDY